MVDVMKYREVRQRFSVRDDDRADSDLFPDRHTVTGVVEFTPKLPKGDVIAYPEEFVKPLPITGRIIAGELFADWAVSDQEEPRPLFLPVTVDDEADQTWSWIMRVASLSIDGQEADITMGDREFQVEAGEGPLWLSTVAGAAKGSGTITLRGPAGASVVGGRDNGDGTMTFLLSDGSETAPVTVPPGPEGRGVVSIVDPDGDGTATVTYSDGTTGELLLPSGPPGEDGADAPLPDVSWDGPVLVVGGERSPDLTGPEGPAPAVSWDGPRLTVGGVTGPDLTGPEGAASTVPGPPGAVPTAADYAIVGPGRPDVPASTGGLVSASTPVGATYTSTDGAGVGAFVWRKRPDGSWQVVDGDTGWVELTQIVGLTDIYTSGRIFAKRQSDRVRLRFYALATTGGDALTTPGQWPVGFRISTIDGLQTWNTATAVTAPLSSSNHGEPPTFITFGRPAHTVDPILRIKGATPAGRGHGELDAYTSDTWPHSLP